MSPKRRDHPERAKPGAGFGGGQFGHWQDMVASEGRSEHLPQRTSIAKYLFDHSGLFADKVVLVMGCACRALGKAMLDESRPPRGLYVFDIQGDDVCSKCSRGAISDLPSRCVLKEGSLESPFSSELLSRQNADRAKADLIVFNHPLFFDVQHVSNRTHEETTKLAERREDLLRAFLNQASTYLATPDTSRDIDLDGHPSVIIPYFDDERELDDSDPGLQAAECGYWTFHDDLYTAGKHHHKVYRLLHRCDTRCGLRQNHLCRGNFRASDDVPHYESIDWVDTLKDPDRGSGPFVQHVAQPLARLVLGASCEKKAGMLTIYYNHGATDLGRLKVEILDAGGMAEEPDTPWCKAFNGILNNPKRQERIRTFDFTKEILSTFIAAAEAKQTGSESRPFFVVCQEDCREPALIEHRMLKMREYSACLTVRFKEPDGERDNDTINKNEILYDVDNLQRFASSPTTERLKKLADETEDAHRRREGVSFFLEWYHEFFKKNHRLKSEGFKNLTMTLLPLWIGTAREPIGLGSILLFTSGRPSNDFLYGAMCNATQYLYPIRLQQWRYELKEQQRQLDQRKSELDTERSERQRTQEAFLGIAHLEGVQEETSQLLEKIDDIRAHAARLRRRVSPARSGIFLRQNDVESLFTPGRVKLSLLVKGLTKEERSAVPSLLERGRDIRRKGAWQAAWPLDDKWDWKNSSVEVKSPTPGVPLPESTFAHPFVTCHSATPDEAAEFWSQAGLAVYAIGLYRDLPLLRELALVSADRPKTTFTLLKYLTNRIHAPHYYPWDLGGKRRSLLYDVQVLGAVLEGMESLRRRSRSAAVFTVSLNDHDSATYHDLLTSVLTDDDLFPRHDQCSESCYGDLSGVACVLSPDTRPADVVTAITRLLGEELAPTSSADNNRVRVEHVTIRRSAEHIALMLSCKNALPREAVLFDEAAEDHGFRGALTTLARAVNMHWPAVGTTGESTAPCSVLLGDNRTEVCVRFDRLQAPPVSPSPGPSEKEEDSESVQAPPF